LDPRSTTKWLLAHFTQLSLERNSLSIMGESDMDSDLDDAKDMNTPMKGRVVGRYVCVCGVCIHKYDTH
jgi:hypothetical protein